MGRGLGLGSGQRSEKGPGPGCGQGRAPSGRGGPAHAQNPHAAPRVLCCVQTSPFIRTPSLDKGHLTPVRPQLNRSHLQRPYSQIKPPLRFWGPGLGHIVLGDRTRPTPAGGKEGASPHGTWTKCPCQCLGPPPHCTVAITELFTALDSETKRQRETGRSLMTRQKAVLF